MKNKIIKMIYAIGDFIIFQIIEKGLIYSFNEYKGIKEIYNLIFNISFTNIVILIAFLIMRFKIPKDKIKIYLYERIYCIIFSIYILIAYSFDKTNTISNIVYDMKSLISFIIYNILLYNFFINIYTWIKYIIINLLDKMGDTKEKVEVSKTSIIKRWINNHPFIFSFSIIFICWLPFAIIRYPAVFEWDAYHQVMQVFGYSAYNAKNPIASTIFMGYTIKIGKAIFGTYERGAFFMVICQMMLCSACLAYSIVVINKLKINPIVSKCILIIYSLSTLFSKYTTAIVKDAIFSCLVVLFVSILVDIFIIENKKTINYFALFVAAFLITIFRSNGLFIVIFCLMGITIGVLNERKAMYFKMMVVFVATIVLYFVYSGMISAKGITGGSIAEALSIPFQQTARYVKYYPEDVTEEEKKVISSVLDYDIIGKEYNPKLSDPVKSTYHGEKGDLKRYFIVWVKQFCKHPLIYFSATFNNCFEYFYPGAEESVVGIYEKVNFDEKVKIFNEQLTNEEGKTKLNDYINYFEKCPLLWIISDVGIQFWIFVYICFYAVFNKKWKILYILIPSITGILICIAGPTFTWNGIRYALPVVYTNPLIIAIMIWYRNKELKILNKESK